MYGWFRGLGLTFKYGSGWWRWTLRDPLRLLILGVVIASLAAVPAYDSGASWATPVEFCGGLAILTMFLAARWFWAGPSVIRLRLEQDDHLRHSYEALIAKVGAAQAQRLVAEEFARR